MSTQALRNAIPQELIKKEVVGTFDVSIHGGAIDTAGATISDFFGINPGEAIRNAKIIGQTDFVGTSATISVGTEAEDPDNILDDTAITSLENDDRLNGVPVPQTIATWIENTGTTFLPVKVQVKTTALTAGKLDVILEIVKLKDL